jgi:hypothetical protein
MKSAAKTASPPMQKSAAKTASLPISSDHEIGSENCVIISYIYIYIYIYFLLGVYNSTINIILFFSWSDLQEQDRVEREVGEKTY